MAKLKIAAWLVLLGFIFPGFAFSKDEFAFLPDSGYELLLKALDKCKKCDSVATLASTKRTPGEWKAYFANQGALKGFDEAQVKELTSYLAINFPIPQKKITANPKKPDFIPMGGRQLLLEKCMSCHLVTLPVLILHKNELGWRQLFTHSDHLVAVSKMDENQLKTLAAYLANNFPISEEKVPEALREPAPQY
jgi:hypothetical protein